jgi:hypothetical protein
MNSDDNLTTRSAHVLGALALGLSALALTGCDGSSDAHALGDAVDTTFYSLLEGGEQGPGTVAVTDVRTGTFAELVAGGFDVDVDPGEHTVYYVDVSFENDGDVPVDLRDPSGVDQDDNLVPSLTVIDAGAGPVFEPCPLLPDTLAPGQRVDGCAIVLAPTGHDIEKISYLADVSEDFVYWESGL